MKFFNRILPRILICSLLSLSSFSEASGQGEEDLLFFGEEKVSTPSRRVQPIEESPSPVTIITADDIRRSGAVNLGEVLALAAGVDSIRRSEAGIEISIRGFNSYSSDKVLVMLDSHPLFNLADASVNWNLVPVPLEDIERVEIVRGPGSALYGENAFFGIINIITKRPGRNSARASAAAGTGGSRLFSASGGAGFLVSAEYQELDRFHTTRSDVPNPFIDVLGIDPVAARAGIQRVFLRWGPEFDGQRFDLATGIIRYETDYSDFTTVDNAMFTSIESVSKQGEIDLHAALRVCAQNREVDRDPFPSGPYRHFVRADGELRAVMTPAVNDTLVYGLLFSHRTARDRVFFPAKKRQLRQAVFSSYLENQLVLADKTLFLTTGLRADAYQGLSTMVSPRAGLILLASPRQAIKLGWGQAFRNPTLYDLYARDDSMSPWVFEGNPGLDQEKITSWNLDYLYQDPERLSVSIDLYYNDIRDLIVFKLDRITATERVYRLENEDRAESYGGEFEIKAGMAKSIQVWANYSYCEAVYSLKDEDVEAPFSPRHKANAGFDYEGGPFSASLWASYVGDHVGVNTDTPFRNRADMNAYGTISGRLGLRLPQDLRLDITMSDITGEGHFEAPTYAVVTPYYFVELSWEQGL